MFIYIYILFLSTQKGFYFGLDKKTHTLVPIIVHILINMLHVFIQINL